MEEEEEEAPDGGSSESIEVVNRRFVSEIGGTSYLRGQKGLSFINASITLKSVKVTIIPVRFKHNIT